MLYYTGDKMEEYYDLLYTPDGGGIRTFGSYAEAKAATAAGKTLYRKDSGEACWDTNPKTRTQEDCRSFCNQSSKYYTKAGASGVELCEGLHDPEFSGNEWTRGTGWMISGDQAVCNGTQTAETRLEQKLWSVCEPGKTYTLTYEISSISSGSITPHLGATAAPARSAKGRYVETGLLCNGGTGFDFTASADFKGSIAYAYVSNGETKFHLNGKNYSSAQISGTGTVYGAAFNPDLAYEDYGINLMSYIAGPYNTGGRTEHLSSSQAGVVRKNLGSTRGKRHLLGMSSYLTPRTMTSAGSSPAVVDFSGDGKRDLAVYRPGTKQCYVRDPVTGATRTISLAGVARDGDMPMAADFDGDGKTDCGVYRRNYAGQPSTWIWYSSRIGPAYPSKIIQAQFGDASDVPLVGLKLTESEPSSIAVFKKNGSLCFRPLSFPLLGGVSVLPERCRSISDNPDAEIITGKFDNDALTDIAVFQRNAYFKILLSSTAYSYSWVQSWGLDNVVVGGQIPLRGVDKDGDGLHDLAVYDPKTGNWHYRLSATGQIPTPTQWGVAGDIPLSGYDFDNDGKTDEVVYRPPSVDDGSGASSFYIRKSSGGWYSVRLGEGADVPFISPSDDGDAVPELWVQRPVGQRWFRYRSTTSAWTAFQWGDYTDTLY